MTPEIPLDLQIMILKRLPMKSLARFKCVSKLWSSHINSQGDFFPSPPRLYVSLLNDCDITEEEVCSADFELLSLSLESTSKSITVFDLDWTKKGIGGQNMMVLRGLIFYTIREKPYIYNPTTGQRVTLPTIEFINVFNRHYYFFGYDPVLDQYKILSFAVSVKNRRTYFNVFVLEPGSFWKRIECDQPHFPSGQGQVRCINGVIYYFAYREYDEVIICFDVRSEEFNIIQLPHETSDHTEYLELIEYDGKPTLFDCMDLPGMVNFWVLEDAEKWSKKSLVLQPCHMHFFAETMNFIGSTQKGEVILQPNEFCSPYYILYYDLQRNDVRKVNIRGISECWFEMALMDTDITESPAASNFLSSFPQNHEPMFQDPVTERNLNKSVFSSGLQCKRTEAPVTSCCRLFGFDLTSKPASTLDKLLISGDSNKLMQSRSRFTREIKSE